MLEVSCNNKPISTTKEKIMYNIRENILHGIEQYAHEARVAEDKGDTDRVTTCRNVIAVLQETLLDPYLEDEENS